MKVLAVTWRRTWKIADPLSRINKDVKVVNLNFHPGKNTIHKTYKKIKSEITRFEPDIVMVDALYVGGLITGTICKQKSITFVVRSGGDPLRARDQAAQGHLSQKNLNKYLKIRIASQIDRMALRLADGRIVVSKSLKKDLTKKSNKSGKRFRVVPQPPKPEIREMDIEPDNTTTTLPKNITHNILTVTNLKYKGKFEGVKLLIDILKRILIKHPNWGYVIAGDGAYINQLKTYINRVVKHDDVKKRLYILGYVPDIGPLYKKSDIFAYVSEIDYYPNTILEAMSMGLPIIANKNRGIMEQINHRGNGILIDKENQSQIETIFLELMNDPQLRDELGSSAQRWVKQSHNLKTLGMDMVQALNQIYELDN